MASEGFRARRIDLSADVGEASLTLVYVVDDRRPETLTLGVPHAPRAGVDLICAAAAIYLGSIALAREVHVARPLPPGMLAALTPVAEALYDVRRWRDGRDLSGAPALTAPDGTSQPEDRPLDPLASTLLWSGGKDSTLGLLTLQANGYDVHPLHATVNGTTRSLEQEAVADLATMLKVPRVDALAVEHPDFDDLARTYSDAWDNFPLNNTVPFGRDLLLAAAAVPWALHRGAGAISLGHDNECRNAFVVHHGKRIPRNDMESAEVASAFERVLREHVHGDLSLLPCVANLSELRILHDMLVHHPELMRRTSFCFWGRNCGRCAKCLRYYLADRVYGEGILSFAANPLADGACPELQEILEEPAMLFAQQVTFLLGRLAQRGDIRPGEDALVRFRETHLARVGPALDAWEAELLEERADPQLPAGFRPASVRAAVLSDATT